MGFTCVICSTPTRDSSLVLGGYRIYTCPGCSLAQAADAFGARPDYDELYATKEYQTQVRSLLESEDRAAFANHPAYAPFFHRMRPAKGHTRLLDVGCGVGRFCHAASAHGWNVSGIDLSRPAIEIGSRHASFPMRAGTLEAVTDSYDVVTSFEVIEHVQDPVGFLATARKVLKPGGRLFCTAPNWNCDEVRTSTRPSWVPPVHLLFFTRESLAAAARRAGFTRVETGLAWTDPLPVAGPFKRAHWLARRALGRPNTPLGLWMTAQ